MTTYVLQQFKRENIQKFLEYTYHSYKAGTVANSTWKLLPRDQFNEESKRLINAFITVAENVNQKRGTHIKFKTVMLQKLSLLKLKARCHRWFLRQLFQFYDVLVKDKITPPVYEGIRQEMFKRMEEYKAIVDFRHVVRKELQGNGLFNEHARLKAKEQLEQGYEYRLYTSNNTIVLKHGQKYGGKLIGIKFEYLGVETEAFMLRLKNEDFLRVLQRIASDISKVIVKIWV